MGEIIGPEVLSLKFGLVICLLVMLYLAFNWQIKGVVPIESPELTSDSFPLTFAIS